MELIAELFGRGWSALCRLVCETRCLCWIEDARDVEMQGGIISGLVLKFDGRSFSNYTETSAAVEFNRFLEGFQVRHRLVTSLAMTTNDRSEQAFDSGVCCCLQPCSLCKVDALFTICCSSSQVQDLLSSIRTLNAPTWHGCRFVGRRACRRPGGHSWGR